MFCHGFPMPVFVSFLPFYCVHQCLICELVPVYLGLSFFFKVLYVSTGALFHERPPNPPSLARLTDTGYTFGHPRKHSLTAPDWMNFKHDQHGLLLVWKLLFQK